MAEAEIIKAVALWITPVLIGIIAFFIRGAFKNYETSIDALREPLMELEKDIVGIKKDIQNLSDAMASVRDIRDDWYMMKRDVEQIALEMKSLKNSLDDVVILKRDQQTIWKRIDEIRKMVNS